MQLLETIQIKDGKFKHIAYHNQRFNASRKALFQIDTAVKLEDIIQIPADYLTGTVRCRVLYEENIQEITFAPYIFKDIRHLQVVDVPTIDYSHKYANRQVFTDLLQQYPDADEVIIVQNGLITDCTIACLAFYDGTEWFVPATPLLKGTRRQQLLDKGLVKKRIIKTTDLSTFQKVCLINTFRDLDLSVAVNLSYQ
ncbi:aminotransferase class IV [Arcicella aquatica]|uniref:Aminotransferase class IV n=1 Tax=Arcicella aquatica TaxID=217141 RepID=A0ABU5QVY2_9BACT|nr:aminotransferase class IV [Arcicella aquatica]MEA5260496.1 aminotransferase class IV [Arcicella aquatica]